MISCFLKKELELGKNSKKVNKKESITNTFSASTGTTVFNPSKNILNDVFNEIQFSFFLVPTFGTGATELPPIIPVIDGRTMSMLSLVC